MKILRSKSFWLIVFVSVFAVQGKAQGAYSDGNSAQLSDTQKTKLLALKAPVAVPTYVPNGFVLKNVTAERNKESNFYIVNYSLEYIDTKGNKFTIDSTNEGIGDHFIIKTVNGKNPYFKGTVMVGPLDPEAEGDSANGKSVQAEWIESLPKYNPKGASAKTVQFYALDAEGITKQEGLKIMLSLRYLK